MHALGTQADRRRHDSPLHVLIVDDNPDVVEVLSDVLRDAGYAVQTAANGGEALRLFAANRPAAVLLDLLMPALNGAQTFAELRRIDPGVPIIIVTGDADEDSARALLREGAFDCVEKPIDLHHLKVIVGAATGRPWPSAPRRDAMRLTDETRALAKIAYAVTGLCRRLEGPSPNREALERRAYGALREAVLGQRDAAVEHLGELHRLLTSGELAGLEPNDAAALRRALAPLRASLPQLGASVTREERAGVDLTGVRILVVDDAPDSLELMSFVLEHCGATVTTAHSAEEAIGAFHHDPVDVLVSDLAMPKRDGVWLVEQLRRQEERRRLVAIAVSGVVRDSHWRVVAAGFDDFLQKPLEATELCRRVAHLLAA